jgi:2-hydroxychromene-2-carboxylate isomerase
MGQPEVVGKVLAAAAFDPSALMEHLSDPKVKQGLKETTEEAVRRGVFGAPTIFIDDEMFFGQDRMDFIEEKLRSGS